MKLWQKAPNSVWYTDEPLKCGKCQKVKKRLFEIQSVGKFCLDCFCEETLKHKSLYVRMIVRTGKGGRQV